jgi:hypothetical protein
MQDFTLGAGLAALAFWGFIASVVVAGIWYDIRKRETQQETLRRMFESGRPMDDALMDKLLTMGGDKADRVDHGLKIAGVILLPTSVGLAILGMVLGMVYPETQLPLLGVAALVACVGLGLLGAAKMASRWYEDDSRSDYDRV